MSEGRVPECNSVTGYRWAGRMGSLAAVEVQSNKQLVA